MERFLFSGFEYFANISGAVFFMAIIGWVFMYLIGKKNTKLAKELLISIKWSPVVFVVSMVGLFILIQLNN